jgi:hypothetical protein
VFAEVLSRFQAYLLVVNLDERRPDRELISLLNLNAWGIKPIGQWEHFSSEERTSPSLTAGVSSECKRLLLSRYVYVMEISDSALDLLALY